MAISYKSVSRIITRLINWILSARFLYNTRCLTRRLSYYRWGNSHSKKYTCYIGTVVLHGALQLLLFPKTFNRCGISHQGYIWVWIHNGLVLFCSLCLQVPAPIQAHESKDLAQCTGFELIADVLVLLVVHSEIVNYSPAAYAWHWPLSMDIQ